MNVKCIICSGKQFQIHVSFQVLPLFFFFFFCQCFTITYSFLLQLGCSLKYVGLAIDVSIRGQCRDRYLCRHDVALTNIFMCAQVIVQVNVGEVQGQGLRITSRCLWDTSTDNYSSVQYKAKNLWCCAMCFGIYTE